MSVRYFTCKYNSDTLTALTGSGSPRLATNTPEPFQSFQLCTIDSREATTAIVAVTLLLVLYQYESPQPTLQNE